MKISSENLKISENTKNLSFEQNLFLKKLSMFSSDFQEFFRTFFLFRYFKKLSIFWHFQNFLKCYVYDICRTLSCRSISFAKISLRNNGENRTAAGGIVDVL